jgi:tetratricopeptide (TPR) repeat protein
MAEATGALAYIAYRCADFTGAEGLAGESLALDRAMGRQAGIAADLWVLANVARCRAEYAWAEQLLAESLEIRRELCDSTGIADSLSTLGAVAQCQGDVRQAQAYHEEALAIRRLQPDRVDIALGLARMGNALIPTGALDAAETALREGLALSRETDSSFGVAAALLGLAAVSRRRDDPATAIGLLLESAERYHELQDPIGLTECIEGLAAAFASQGLHGPAARLYGAAEAQRDRLGAPLPPCDRDSRENALQAIRAALGEKAYAQARAAGSSLPPDSALKVAKRFHGFVGKKLNVAVRRPAPHTGTGAAAQ